MKRMIKKIAAGLTACLMLGLTSMPALAQSAQGTKEEVVYVSLNADGTFGNAYVVNSFDLTAPGHIVDYGSYQTVVNLSTMDPISVQNDKVEIDAPEGRFYYQGDLESAELPWLITVSYLLDGKPVAADDLAGAKGHLEIQFHIRNNTKAQKVFAQNYALQITLTLDTDRCTDIRAEGATLANSGKDKVVSFIKLPDREADYNISANVKDFEMEGTQISGIPLSVDMELLGTDSLTGGISNLQNGIRDLDSGAQDLCQGAGDLKDGTQKLQDGLLDMQAGMTDLENGFNQLVGGNTNLQNGSQQILDALNAIQEKLDSFTVTASDLEQLAEGSTEIFQGISQLSGGLGALQGSFDQADAGIRSQTGNTYSGLQHANEATIDSLNQQIALLQDDPETNAAQIQQLTLIVSLLSANNELVTGLKTGIDGDGISGNPGLAAGAAALMEQYEQFDATVQALPTMLADMAAGMSQLKDGLDQLTANYETFYAGVLSYSGNTAAIYDGYKQLCDGFADMVKGCGDLNTGVRALYDGTKQLVGGTAELNSQAETMDTDMQKQIDEALASYSPSDFDIVSFVSSRNTNVKSVQFVMLTERIEKEQKENVSMPETSEPTFWQRLLALFGL